MKGSEHYVEAERLLKVAEAELSDYSRTRDKEIEEHHLNQASLAQQRAQVHATLAQVAALAELKLPTYDNSFSSLAESDYRGWGPAVGV